MPIKKIIVSEDLLKKLEKPDNPIFVVGIPTGTAPSATGDYVLHEVQQKYPFVTVASSTVSTISFVAKQAEKEKMKLKSVKFHLGLPPSLDFEWEKE